MENEAVYRTRIGSEIVTPRGAPDKMFQLLDDSVMAIGDLLNEGSQAGQVGDNAAGLSKTDLARTMAALTVLEANGLRDFAITGGIAVAAHLASCSPVPRPLNDLDIIVAGAAAIPSSLATGVLVSHVHLDAKPGRMLLQLVEPTSRLRIDVFDALRGQMERSRAHDLSWHHHRIVSPADSVARLTGLLLDLGLDEVVPAKHASDHAAMLARGPVDGVEVAWADHRRTRHPAAFFEACRQVEALTLEKAHLLTDQGIKASTPCDRCRDARGFSVAAAEHIVAAIGYR